MKRFAFLVHPRDVADVARYSPKAAGKRPELVAKILEWLPPYHLSEITGVRSAATGEEIGGAFIAVPLLPTQIVGLPWRDVVDRIVAAARLAHEKHGAQIVGLGGYTAVVGGSGKVVAERSQVPITSGNCYTVAIALEAATRAAELLDIDLASSTVTVVGATGSIGSVCARELARKVGRLILVARSRSRLLPLAERICREGRTAVAIELDATAGVRQADVVISATSSGGSLIGVEALKPGALVCDVGVPHDVTPAVARQRPDVLVIDGGIVEAPGQPDFGFDFGYPPGLCMACMAETMTLTLESRFENFSIGRGLEYQNVAEIAR
ncbi:MAG TPA: shikimate dehydrogenase, partial [Candidatus Nitrosotenuis sp.]|nr:shikimate dehydrogenase [Candidatus Nitrosotenuis sp.]